MKKMTVFQKSFECYLIYNSLYLRTHNFLSNMTRKFRALQITEKKSHSDSGNWITVKLGLTCFHKSFIFFFFKCVWLLPACVYTMCTQYPQMAVEGDVPLSWSYRQLRAAMCVLGIQPAPSERAGSPLPLSHLCRPTF